MHEVLGSRASNGSKIVDEVGLGHSNTSVTNDELVVLLVGNKLNPQFLFTVQETWVSEGLIANLVDSVRSIADQLSKNQSEESSMKREERGSVPTSRRFPCCCRKCSQSET